MLKRTLLLPLALLALVMGCTEDPVSPAQALRVTAQNLPALDNSAYYELWLSYVPAQMKNEPPAIDHSDLVYFSAGKFRVTGGSTLVGLDGAAATFTIPAGYTPGLIGDAIVTVEQTGKNDTVPGARLLGGDFTGSESLGRATLTVSSSEVFGNYMTDTLFRSGTFILDSPTSPDTNDFARGIWFAMIFRDIVTPDTVRKSLGVFAQPLNSHNPRWTYEGWLVREQGGTTEYVSLGRFDNATKADETKAGAGAGSVPDAAFDKPGEDFVAAGKERTLNDGTYRVVVSLQPFGISLSRPLLTLMESDPIPAGLGRQQPATLKPILNDPLMEVTLDR